MMKYARFLSLLLLPLIAGCPKPPVPGCSLGSRSVGKTTVDYITSGRSIVIAVWSDVPSSPLTTFGRDKDQGPGHLECHCWRDYDGKRVLDWKAATSDGKNWAFTLNDKEFQLAEGNLLLVRTRGEAIKITQVKQDLSGVDPKGGWQELAEKSLEVKEFLAQASDKKED